MLRWWMSHWPSNALLSKGQEGYERGLDAGAWKKQQENLQLGSLQKTRSSKGVFVGPGDQSAPWEGHLAHQDLLNTPPAATLLPKPRNKCPPLATATM